MFAGHFGLAAIVKARVPEAPLWALMLSTQLLDVAFVPMLLSGTETMESITGENASASYGHYIIHADYTHSLIGALFMAFVAGLIAYRLWGKRIGIIIGGVAISHWLLDLLVHRPDLPILPGHADNLPLLGLGLWQWPALSIALEALLILIGAALYGRSILSIPAVRKPRAWIAGGIMAILLVLSLITDVLGIA